MSIAFEWKGFDREREADCWGCSVDKYPYVRIVTAEGEGEIKAVTSVPAHDGESGYHEVVASLEVPITRVYG